MAKPTIALQVYTIRDHVKNRQDFTASMKKLAEIGYTAIEFAGTPSDMTDEEVRQVCDQLGLKIISSHVVMDGFEADFDARVRTLKTYGTKLVSMPVPPSWVHESGDYATFGKKSTELGKKLAALDLTLSYHNHSFEFEHFTDKPALDVLYEASDPDFLKAQLDTCWVQRGGGSVVSYIKKYAGRMPTIHLKDHSIVKNEFTMTPVGDGNLDWKRILKAAEKAGVKYFIVEQDDTHGDAFGAAARSYQFLRGMGYK